MKNGKVITITNSPEKVSNKSGLRPNKMYIKKGREFCNRSMKSWWQDNDKEIYSTHKEGKPVVGENFVRILNNKLYLHMPSVSNNM